MAPNQSFIFEIYQKIPIRHETASKECIHISLGIMPEGQKAVLGYEIAPNENNASWFNLLDKLQNQGIHKGFGQCSDTLESLFD